MAIVFLVTVKNRSILERYLECRLWVLNNDLEAQISTVLCFNHSTRAIDTCTILTSRCLARKLTFITRAVNPRREDKQTERQTVQQYHDFWKKIFLLCSV